MKMFIPLLFILSLALAEPPVGDGYAAARSSYDIHDHDHGHDHSHEHYDHSNDIQRSISQDYGPPAQSYARNTPSSEYGLPNARTASQKSYLPPDTGSISQEYGVPARSSQYSSARSLSTEYGVPDARSTPSQLYGAPARNSLSQEYGVPSLRSDISKSLSSQYGAPELRTPSEEYGVPSQRSFGRTPSQKYGPPSARQSFSRNSLSQTYEGPSARSGGFQSYSAPRSSAKSFASSSRFFKQPSQFGARLSSSYAAPAARNTDSYSQNAKALSQTYGAPQRDLSDTYGVPSARNSDSYSQNVKSLSQTYGAPSQRDLSDTYGAPAARNFDSYSLKAKTLSQTYGAPSQRDLSDTYGAPNTRGVSQEYGVPSSRAADLKTSAIASSYSGASGRSSVPSDTYGAPAARDSMPSEEYGAPDQYSNSNKGYSYARDALNELLNQEPANYDFAYKVSDYESGSDFGHTETRQHNRAEGSYFVVLPDGTKQVVEYEADERGFKPRISVEPADIGRSGGYDDNAADLTRSEDGPY